MAYKLHLPDGLIVEVDTSTELHEAVRLLRPATTPVRPVQQPALPVQQNGAAPPDTATLRRFIRGMPSLQRNILDCLNGTSEGMNDVALRVNVGLEDNSKLGGTMSGLSKRAVKFGFTFNDVILKEIQQTSSGRHYLYTLTQGMRAAMNK
jgi:hypothetical protein